jgi:hypothetical protein
LRSGGAAAFQPQIILTKPQRGRLVSMSNVINRQDIKFILKRPNDRHETLMRQACYRALEHDERCLRLVSTYPHPAPANLSREQFEARGPYYEFVLVPEVAAILKRIDGWLAKAIEDKERWIEKTDASGRVRRLSHIKTLQEALALCEEDASQARKRELAEKERKEGNNPGEVQIAHRFCDATFAVRLKTPSALAWEGRQMRHCLGSGALRRAPCAKARTVFLHSRSAGASACHP